MNANGLDPLTVLIVGSRVLLEALDAKILRKLPCYPQMVKCLRAYNNKL